MQIDSQRVARVCRGRQMGRAVAAMLLPSGHPIHSFINDGMDLCVWLQILQVLVVEIHML